MEFTLNDIITICKTRVDLSLLTAKNNVLCVDGTSCTKKTSILSATKRTVVKTQRTRPTCNIDTYFPSAIGYICAGVNNVYCGGPHFEDRSPMNVLDWHVLWKIFNNYVRRYGNVHVDENEYASTLEEYRTIFRTLKMAPAYTLWSQHFNTIALIDSNVNRCDQLRLSRGQSSDRERSLWQFYTPLQNLMYSELYPNLIIDWAWFENTPTDVVVEGIAKFLNNTLDYLVETDRERDPAPIIDLFLPTIKTDMTLNNITVHAYRSIGRNGCKQLMGVADNLTARIPRFVNVTNIKSPFHRQTPPIMSNSLAYILKSEPIEMDGDFGIMNGHDSTNIDHDDETDYSDAEIADMF